MAVRMIRSWSCRSTVSRARIFDSTRASPVAPAGPGNLCPPPLHTYVESGRVVNTGTSPCHSSAISSSSRPGRAGVPRAPVRSSPNTCCRSVASRIRSGCVDSCSSVAYVQVGRGTKRISSRAKICRRPLSPSSSSRESLTAVYAARNPSHSASVNRNGSARTPSSVGRLADSVNRPAVRVRCMVSVPAPAQEAVSSGDRSARPPPTADMSSAVVSPTSNCGSSPTRWTEACRARAAGSAGGACVRGGWNSVSTSTRTGCGPQAMRFSWCRSVPSRMCSSASSAPRRR